jgi:hypothetical protein
MASVHMAQELAVIGLWHLECEEKNDSILTFLKVSLMTRRMSSFPDPTPSLLLPSRPFPINKSNVSK